MQSETIKPEHTSIAHLIREVNEKKLLLPEFQRPFIWSIEQTKDLLDSLTRGIFIGAFMLAKPQFDLSCREIETRPRSGKGSRAKLESLFYRKIEFEGSRILVVLDGQQRITSICRVLKGFDKLYFVFQKPENLPNPSEEITSFEQIIQTISFKQDPENLSFELGDVYKIGTWKERDIRTKIFNPVSSIYSFLEDSEQSRERYFDLLIDLKRLFSQLIEDKTLLSVFFLDMDLEKFCMFFERSNSRGTELNFIDIVTAKIYKDFNLDRNIKDFRDKYKGVLFDNAIVEAFVRYISFLKVGQVDRKSILNSLDGNDFNTYWNEICDMYVKASNYLVSQRIIMATDWVPYKTMFIPIIHLVRHLPNKDFSMMTTEQAKLFKFWFWASLLNVRYGGGMVGSTNDIIVEDCHLMKDIADNRGFSPTILRRYKFEFTFDDFLNLTSTGAVFTGIMSILHNKYQVKNLSNHNNIDFGQKVDVHHIFPVNYVRQKFPEESFENENRDSILNKMLIEKIPNIKYSDLAPSSYLKDPPANQNPLLQESLNSHLVPSPADLIAGKFDEDYKTFLSQRFELLKKLIDEEVRDIKLKLVEQLEQSQKQKN